MKFWIAFALFLLAVSGGVDGRCQESAQARVELGMEGSGKLEMPSIDFHTGLQPGSSVTEGSGATASSVERVTLPIATTPRVADRKYFLLNGMQAGMAVFDVEMTQHCIRARKCSEANPFMPSSQAGALSVDFALTAYEGLWSYFLKKHHSKLWWITPVAGTAVHAAGVATGFEHY
jgi:hypothetical protein